MKPGARTIPLVLLVPLCLLPATQTAVAVYWQWRTPVSYPAFKALMIALPILVWLWARGSGRPWRERVGLKRTSLLPGLVAGLLMGGVILAGYYTLLRPMIDPAPVVTKLRSMGLLEYYWAMALVIPLWNALFEEYYWRAFLVGELRDRISGTWGVCAIGGALFGLHHVFSLLPVFETRLVGLFVLGTMVAGAAWTWMRVRGYSIWDCYASHVLADAAIMWIGYDLIRAAQ